NLLEIGDNLFLVNGERVKHYFGGTIKEVIETQDLQCKVIWTKHERRTTLKENKEMDEEFENFIAKGKNFELRKERLTTFYLTPEELAVILVVQEFYLALKERETKRPYNDMRAYVNGVDVLVTPGRIFQYFDAPYYYCDFLFRTDLYQFKNIDMDEVVMSLAEGREEWTYELGTNLPTTNQALITPLQKI
ncbi:hypothetical protein Goari_018417, partial [Gossypium aridum]|nr:hypothetical protein [Gossypium aridum]